MKNCGKTMAERRFGPDTGCQCNQCKADRKALRVKLRKVKRDIAAARASDNTLGAN